MSIIEELRRRNVFRVGIAYVVITWLLLQVADVVVAALKVRLLGEAPKSVEVKPEAYALYLQGRYFLGRRTQQDWENAALAFEQALEIEPDYASAWAGLSLVLGAQAGQSYRDLHAGYVLAREAANKAMELDPLAMRGYHQLGLALIWAEQLDEAQAVYHQLLTLNPEYTSANLSLSRILLLQGNLKGAMEAVEREREPFWREYGILITLYAQGRSEEADMRLVDFIEQNHADSAYQIATIYGFRGDADQVFEWLDLAYVQRDGGLPEMLSDPFLNQFSDDPHWVEILKKMGLYEAWLRVQA